VTPPTLQVGLDPRQAVVLAGVSPSTARLIEQFDGTRDIEGLRASAAGLGLGADAADSLLAIFGGASMLDDAASDDGPGAAITLAERERLSPDLAAASLVSGGADAGLATISRRQAATVSMVGAGRVGAAVAVLLAAAGIGRIAVEDAATATDADRSPGGIGPGDVGAVRAQATLRAVRRVSSSTRTKGLPPGWPDLVILAPTGAPDARRLDDLVRTGTPHLLATIREVTGIVGPFVFPGASACRRCLDLHRRDRDPSWPLIAAQLATESRRVRQAACDVVLATQVAAICAAQALHYLDGKADHRHPATRNGTLELRLTEWQVRRRSWPPHPACGCHWPANDPAVAEASAPTAPTPTTAPSPTMEA
jgi:bacteriocin biosynthesis cyclodehydratase domain-containing protein